MTFLPFLLNRSRLPICSYNLFLFWPVTLESVKKKRINACILINKISLKKKKSIYAYVLINKISKKKKKKIFYIHIEKQKKLNKKKKKKKKKKKFYNVYL